VYKCKEYADIHTEVYGGQTSVEEFGFALYASTRYHCDTYLNTMIAKLTGIVADVYPDCIVLDVHGVGYRIITRHTDYYTQGTEITLHTYLAVRENALDLYGFPTLALYILFIHLIKIPKIGPKTAMHILSQTDTDTLKKAVVSDDAVYLSKVSGIGKKSAEKIVSGLRDVLDVHALTDTSEKTSMRDGDVIEALISLGYSQKDALEATQKIPADIVDTHERIKYALKYVH
jgi:holliday junction DNA helicase RuvA